MEEEKNQNKRRKEKRRKREEKKREEEKRKEKKRRPMSIFFDWSSPWAQEEDPWPEVADDSDDETGWITWMTASATPQERGAAPMERTRLDEEERRKEKKRKERKRRTQLEQ